MKTTDRSRILVAGTRDFDRRPFIIRGLVLENVDLREIDEKALARARGILVAEHSGKLGQFSVLSNGLFRRACDLGVMTAYWPADNHSEGQVAHYVSTIPEIQPRMTTGARTWFYINRDLEMIAEVARSHEPGPGIGAAIIESREPGKPIDPEHQRLMRRAFADASKLIVEHLSGGKSADGAYRIYATITDQGPQPTPFVFKVGRPDPLDEWANPISKERENYIDLAEPFIPFHLRPGLNTDRCVTTPFSAALVCNFVDSATSLELVLVNRQGAGTIFSLFETTLRGLRAHTLISDPKENAIKDFISSRVDAKRIRKDPQLRPRIEIAKRLGLLVEPEDLETLLVEAATGLSARQGVYHGDLHLGNVMVRHRDAIAIDFGSMRVFGPITADPSSLEASIVFGMRKEELPEHQTEWKEFVDKLYTSPLDPPLPTADHFHFAWINRAIRELRHVVHCCGVSRKEALLVLAASLLRYARFSPCEFEDSTLQETSEKRKAYAMVVAHRLYIEATKAICQEPPK